MLDWRIRTCFILSAVDPIYWTLCTSIITLQDDATVSRMMGIGPVLLINVVVEIWLCEASTALSNL